MSAEVVPRGMARTGFDSGVFLRMLDPRCRPDRGARGRRFAARSAVDVQRLPRDGQHEVRPDAKPRRIVDQAQVPASLAPATGQNDLRVDHRRQPATSREDEAAARGVRFWSRYGGAGRVDPRAEVPGRGGRCRATAWPSTRLWPATLKTAVDSGPCERASGGATECSWSTTVGETRQAVLGWPDIAFVGGSLFFSRRETRAATNLMETGDPRDPPCYSAPYNFSFKETVEDLLAADAGQTSCAIRPSSRAAIVSLVTDSGARTRKARCTARKRVVTEGQGATQRNYAFARRVAQGACVSACHAATLGRKKCHDLLGTWAFDEQKSTFFVRDIDFCGFPIGCS